MGFCRHLGLCYYHVQAAEYQTAPAASLSPFAAPPDAGPSSLAHFHPVIAVVVGALTITFSLTFLFLLYAKHYKQRSGGGADLRTSSAATAAARNSGVEWTVVLSLPVFRFGSLLGHKEGLECAVCLARFKPAEVLRLLPKCKHAFHVECVDTWLDAHSTCPLCRSRVDPEDVLLVPDAETPPAEAEPAGAGEKGGDGTGNPSGRRVSGRHSSAGEKSSNTVQQVVAHRPDPDESRYRRSADSMARTARAAALSVGCLDRGRKDALLLAEKEGVERRFGHRIVVSSCGEGEQERWSDLMPSDLLFLRSEMIITGSGRHSVSRTGRPSCTSASVGGVGGMSVISSARCVSEITGVGRHLHPSGGGARRVVEGERTMKRWLGFGAKRSAQWVRTRDRG